MRCNFQKLIIIDTARKNRTALKLIMHCDVTSRIFAYYSKRNSSRKKQNNELLRQNVGAKFRCIDTLKKNESKRKMN